MPTPRCMLWWARRTRGIKLCWGIHHHYQPKINSRHFSGWQHFQCLWEGSVTLPSEPGSEGRDLRNVWFPFVELCYKSWSAGIEMCHLKNLWHSTLPTVQVWFLWVPPYDAHQVYLCINFFFIGDRGRGWMEAAGRKERKEGRKVGGKCKKCNSGV